MRSRTNMLLTMALAPLLLCLGCSEAPPPGATAPAPVKVKAKLSVTKPVATPKPAPLTFTLPPEHVFGAEVKLGEFTVKAVNRYWAGPHTTTLTLEEAFEQKLCTISETGISNSVVAEVRGKYPVLLLTGDMLIGGRQDRLVAHSMLLEPGTTIVPVFCAEISRWTPENGEYDETFKRDRQSPQVDLNVKAAVYQQGTQAAVWSAISQVTAGLDSPDPHGTGSYRLAFDAPTVQVAIDKMFLRARKIVCAFTVGFAVYRDNEIVAADIFDSTQLLDHVADKLLRGYAMTAVYGDVTNWKIELPEEPTKDETKTPEPRRVPHNAPGTYDPPPVPLGEFQQDGTLRFVCRQTPDVHPIHTGIFRGKPKP